MNWVELFILSLGLSMDAFAVAVSIGLTLTKSRIKNALIVGLYFGIFQAVMPLIGYLAASQFAGHITRFSHWIAFGLLCIIGGKMVFFCRGDNGLPEISEASLSPKKMLPLAVATSIDALAVGVSLGFLDVGILPTVMFIGIITFAMSVAGVGIGNIFGAKYKSKAIFIGGVILVLMGIKILIEGIIG